MYDEHLAGFLRVCSNRFYTIKGLYFQHWKLLFLPVQHSSLPLPGNYTSTSFGDPPHPKPSRAHEVCMGLTPPIHTTQSMGRTPDSVLDKDLFFSSLDVAISSGISRKTQERFISGIFTGATGKEKLFN